MMLDFGELPIEAVVVSGVTSARTCYTNEGEHMCHSDDGVVPAADTETPQAKKCAICVHNQWGSKITPNGKRGKRCREFSQLSLIQLNSPDTLSLVVPATSLRALRDYEKQVVTRGEKLSNVVTKIDTVESNNRTSLSFRVTRFLQDGELDELKKMSTRQASAFAVTDGFTFH